MKKEKRKIPEMVVNGKGGAKIKVAVDAYLGIQKARIEASNRINMFVERFGLSEEEAKEWHERMDEKLHAVEKQLQKEFRNQLQNFEIHKRLIAVKGVAETLSAQLIAIIQDPRRFKTVSKLWKYAGLGLREDGSIQKRVKGGKVDYNPRLKTLCWKLTDSWIKHHNGYYGKLLKEFKADEERKNKPFKVKKQDAIGYIVAESGVGIPKGTKVKKNNLKKIKKDEFLVIRCKSHILNRARRRVAKRFLAQLWATWLNILGVPHRQPYVKDMLGHQIDEELPIETKRKEEVLDK